MHRDNNNSREAHYSSKQMTALVNSATSVGKANLSPTEFIASKREAFMLCIIHLMLQDLFHLILKFSTEMIISLTG